MYSSLFVSDYSLSFSDNSEPVEGEVFVDGEYEPKDCALTSIRAEREGIPRCVLIDENTSPQANGSASAQFYAGGGRKPLVTYVADIYLYIFI